VGSLHDRIIVELVQYHVSILSFRILYWKELKIRLSYELTVGTMVIYLDKYHFFHQHCRYLSGRTLKNPAFVLTFYMLLLCSKTL